VPEAFGSVEFVLLTSDEVPVVLVAPVELVPAAEPVWSVAAPFWSTVVLDDDVLDCGTVPVVPPVVEFGDVLVVPDVPMEPDVPEVLDEPAASGVVLVVPAPVPVVELLEPTPLGSVWLLTPGEVVLLPEAFGVVVVEP